MDGEVVWVVDIVQKAVKTTRSVPLQETKILLFSTPCQQHCPAHTLNSSQHDRKRVRVHSHETSARDGSGCLTETTGGELGRRACGVKCRKHGVFWDSVCLGPSPLPLRQEGMASEVIPAPLPLCASLLTLSAQRNTFPINDLSAPRWSVQLLVPEHTPVPPGFPAGPAARGVTSVREQSSLPG